MRVCVCVCVFVCVCVCVRVIAGYSVTQARRLLSADDETIVTGNDHKVMKSKLC